MQNRYKKILVSILFLSFAGLNTCTKVQKAQDLSGTWTIKYTGIEYGCRDADRNRDKEGVFIFTVTQQGNSVSAIFNDGNTTNTITGKIIGHSIHMVVNGLTANDCRVETFLEGDIVMEDMINGSYWGNEINCETCKWDGKFVITIEKGSSGSEGQESNNIRAGVNLAFGLTQRSLESF